MRRSREHRIGDTGELRAAHIFAQYGWVVEKLQSDYGFDFLLQRVDGENVTGDFALVQVKSTQRSVAEVKNRALELRISTRHLLLWEETPIPSFLVVVDLSTDKIWALDCKRWILAIRQASGDGDFKKKSYRIESARLTVLDVKGIRQMAASVADYWRKFRSVTIATRNVDAVFNWDLEPVDCYLKLNSRLYSLIGEELADKVAMGVMLGLSEINVLSAPNAGPQASGRSRTLRPENVGRL